MSANLQIIESSIWKEIRNSALTIVFLTRRRDGFLGLPVNWIELTQTYAPSESDQDAERREESTLGGKFGHASITVTFNGLSAIESAAGKIPLKICNDALNGIATHRGTSGGYGFPKPRHGVHEISAVPRHTGMAIIARIEYDGNRRSAELFEELSLSASWLLKCTLPTGGWPFNFDPAERTIGFQSTAASICALCLFYRGYSDKKSRERSRASAAVAKALLGLKGSQKSGFWSGDGVPNGNEARDSAFALRLLVLGYQASPDLFGADGGDTLRQMLDCYFEQNLGNGWPVNATNPRWDLGASIGGLSLFQSLTTDASNYESLVIATETEIIRLWQTKGLFDRLHSWDWQSLALVSGKKVGPIDSSVLSLIELETKKLRDTASAMKLKQNDLLKLHVNIKKPAIFCLTKGTEIFPMANPVRGIGIRKWLTDGFNRILWGLLGTVIAGILSFICFKYYGIKSFDDMLDLLITYTG